VLVKAGPWQAVRWAVVGVLLPFMLLGLYGLVTQVYGLLRYDPAYFAPEYAQKYETPGSAARAVETALQTGDRPLMSELEGRQAAKLAAMPDVIFVMLEGRTPRYSTYLYVNRDTYDRVRYHVEQVRGRYVVTPSDLYYYLHSGRWIDIFVPAAAGWWALEFAVLLALGFYRLSARMREQMYGG
jgi:hypothetical protein